MSKQKTIAAIIEESKIHHNIRINFSKMPDYSEEDGFDWSIVAGGCLRSSKQIYYDGERFQVFNCIDGTFQVLTEKRIMSESYSNIGKALKLNALFLQKYEPLKK